MHARVGFNCNIKWIQWQSLSNDEHEVWAAMFSHAKSFNMSTVSVQKSMLHKWSCRISAESCFPIPKDGKPRGRATVGTFTSVQRANRSQTKIVFRQKKKLGMPKAEFQG